MKSFKFKTQLPKVEQYIGRTVVIDGKPVVIKTIMGNRFKPQFYEINGDHLIGMLRFHAQMLGDRSITEKQFQDFENMDISAEKLSDKDSKNETTSNRTEFTS